MAAVHPSTHDHGFVLHHHNNDYICLNFFLWLLSFIFWHSILTHGPKTLRMMMMVVKPREKTEWWELRNNPSVTISFIQDLSMLFWTLLYLYYICIFFFFTWWLYCFFLCQFMCFTLIYSHVDDALKAHRHFDLLPHRRHTWTMHLRHFIGIIVSTVKPVLKISQVCCVC